MDCYPVTLDTDKSKLAELNDADFYVTKMKFAKKGKKHTVVYNHQITIRGAKYKNLLFLLLVCFLSGRVCVLTLNECLMLC